MGWQCEWRVTCEQCPALGPRSQGQDTTTAERLAVKQGWLAWEGFYGRFHACPACKNNLTEELRESLAESNEVRGNCQ